MRLYFLAVCLLASALTTVGSMKGIAALQVFGGLLIGHVIAMAAMHWRKI